MTWLFKENGGETDIRFLIEAKETSHDDMSPFKQQTHGKHLLLPQICTAEKRKVCSLHSVHLDSGVKQQGVLESAEGPLQWDLNGTFDLHFKETGQVNNRA